MGNTLGALDLTANGGSGNWISDADPDNPNKPDKLDSMPGVTVSMWINVRGTISNTTTLASDVANVPVPAGQGGWSFGIGGPDPSNSNVFMEVWNSNSGAGQGSSFRINADRQWVMVAGSFDNATHQLKTYFGTPTSSVVASNVTGAAPDRILLPNDQPFMVAKMPFASPTVPAWIDDVRVYDHALTLSELEAARVAGVPEPCAGVLCAGMMLMTTRRVSR
jgi:hypothetical protein